VKRFEQLKNSKNMDGIYQLWAEFVDTKEDWTNSKYHISKTRSTTSSKNLGQQPQLEQRMQAKEA
jgi:hypothetical protein